MTRAIERHNTGEAKVVPIIVRPCDWHETPFGSIMAAPKDGKAITAWANLDEAFLDIVTSIKSLLRAFNTQSASKSAAVPPAETALQTNQADPFEVTRPRSANLRIRKSFSDNDKDEFIDEAFSYMASFFESSLEELDARNDHLKTKYKRIYANSFTATIYQNGDATSQCKIRLGGMMGTGISYSANDQVNDNSFNENLSVEFDDQHMFLKPLGMAIHLVQQGEQLTFEGASEYYWSMLMDRLQ